MDSCLRHIDRKHKKRFINSRKPGRTSIDSLNEDDQSVETKVDKAKCWCSDESYIYGRDLSLGILEKPTTYL